MTRHNVLSELGALHLSRPAVDAPAEVVAAWYERKATVLDHLATETSNVAGQAQTAREHAMRLGVAA